MTNYINSKINIYFTFSLYTKYSLVIKKFIKDVLTQCSNVFVEEFWKRSLTLVKMIAKSGERIMNVIEVWTTKLSLAIMSALIIQNTTVKSRRENPAVNRPIILGLE